MKGDFYIMAHRSTSSSDRAMNVLIGIIIAAFVAVGGYAVYNKVSDNIFNKAVQDGTAPQTVKTLARQAGQSVKEFLEENGITDGSVDGNTSTQDFYSHMTVSRYAAYNGQDFDTLVSQYGLTGKVTEDTSWSDAQKLIPLGTYIGLDASSDDAASQFEQFKQFYGLGDDVTMDTPWGDVEDTINAAQEAMKNATAAPEDTESATTVPEDDTVATAAPAE